MFSLLVYLLLEGISDIKDATLHIIPISNRIRLIVMFLVGTNVGLKPHHITKEKSNWIRIHYHIQHGNVNTILCMHLNLACR